MPAPKVIMIISKMMKKLSNFGNERLLNFSRICYGRVLIANETRHVQFGWHRDASCKLLTLRIIIPLVGEGTCFTPYQININNHPDFRYNDNVVKANDALVPLDRRRQLQEGEAVFFLKEHAIHTAPLKKGPRMLIIMDAELNPK